jgi:hypothetical protein
VKTTVHSPNSLCPSSLPVEYEDNKGMVEIFENEKISFVIFIPSCRFASY